MGRTAFDFPSRCNIATKCICTTTPLGDPVQPKRVVQTEVDPVTYGRLKHLADRRSVPLKAVLREALKSYVDTEEGRLEEDTVFQIVGRLKLAGRTWSERKDWRP